MKIRSSFIAALVGGLLASSVAHAATVNFTISDLGTPEATGSFSYSSAAPVLSYGDLTDFNLTIGAANYALPFVQSSTNYDYFQFDTTTNTFVPGDANGTYGPLGPFLLSAFASDFSSGFDFFSSPRDNFTEITQGVYDMPYDTVAVTTAAVPEPSSLPVLLMGLSLIGGALYFGRKKAIAG